VLWLYWSALRDVRVCVCDVNNDGAPAIRLFNTTIASYSSTAIGCVVVLCPRARDTRLLQAGKFCYVSAGLTLDQLHRVTKITVQTYFL